MATIEERLADLEAQVEELALKNDVQDSFISGLFNRLNTWLGKNVFKTVAEFWGKVSIWDTRGTPLGSGSIPDYRPPFDFVLTAWTLKPDESNADIRAREGDTTYCAGTLVARKPLRPYWER